MIATQLEAIEKERRSGAKTAEFKTGQQPVQRTAESDVLALQRATGNRAVEALLNSDFSGMLQRAAANSPPEGDAPPASLDRVLASPGKPLDVTLRQDMEQRFQHDFFDVRTYSDLEANKSAREVGAVAFASGRNVIFGQGAFRPNERRGRALLAHELAHVVQQRSGADMTVGTGTSASLEAEADSAAQRFAHGAHHIPIQGRAGLSLLRATELPDEDAAVDEEEKKKATSQATMTAVTQRPKDAELLATRLPDATPLKQPVQIINAPNKSKGTRGEITVPFDRYRGEYGWNFIGGGSASASSSINLARRSFYDKQRGQEGTAGTDFIAENVKTGWLVAGGEQKATQGNEFTRTTAITTSLEKNLAHSAETLQLRIDSGSVKEPAEVARLQKTIERLQATQTALEKGRLGEPAELPAGVVFELTNVGGEGKQIGKGHKGHIDLLAKKYGKNPAFLEHILSRTFVRDAALAKAKGRDPGGQRGTDTDPDIVPATELLTGRAEDELARRRAGKSERQWKAKKAEQKAADERVRSAARAAEKKAQHDQRAAAEAEARDQARQLGEKARQQRLKQLQEERAQKNEPEPPTKRLRERADRKLEREAKEAGKLVEKSSRKEFLDQLKQQEAEVKAKRRADAQLEKKARQQQLDAERQVREQRQNALDNALKEVNDLPSMTPLEWGKLPKEMRQKLEKLAAQEPRLAARLNEKVNAKQTQEFHNWAAQENTEVSRRNAEISRRNAEISSYNAEVPKRNQSAKNEARLGKAAHGLNQGAALFRAGETLSDALNRGEGIVSAAFGAGKTYLDNTNPAFGAIATAQQRQQKDASGQQYYGTDAVDAWLGTLGETGAGYLVPGAGWDQLVNAGANLSGAIDDHLQKGSDPSDPTASKVTPRTATDLAADVTPSRMFAQTIGGGLRAYYDIGRAVGGDTKGVDKFADDTVRGKLGSVLQPWAMAADFLSNLGGDSAGVALEKTIKKTEGTTLTKLGYASGDAMYELGQNKEAKSGKHGMAVQGISQILGMASDMIAGKSFDKALNDAADAGKGSLADTVGSAMGDAAFTAVEKGKEIVNEDLPAAKKKVEEKIEQTKKRLADWWKSL